MEYSYHFGSSFPNALLPVGTKKDIDNTVKNLVSQYYAYLDDEDIDSANELYQNHKSSLEDYIIDMAYINRLEEEIYNIGLSALTKVTNIIGLSEPTAQADDGFWYQDY